LYQRALQLNPGYVVAHHWIAINYFAMLGRMDEAVAELEIARQLDPLSSILVENRGFLSTLCRRYEEALEHFRYLLSRDPSFYKAYASGGRALIQLGRYGEAIEMLRRGRALAGDVASILGALGQAHALAGDRAEAERLLAELHRLAELRQVHTSCFATI